MTQDSRDEVLQQAKLAPWEVCALLAGYAIPTASLILSIKTGDSRWFSRSGSLMVIFGAVLEYKNFAIQQKLNEIAQESTKFYGAEPEKWRVPSSRRIFDKAILLLLVAGTFIWGYGDLFVGNA